MLIGRRVEDVDPSAQCIKTTTEDHFGHRTLIWATGGRPRKLSIAGSDLAGIHIVRNRADVDAMLGELANVTQVVIIGGGYIGLEAAAVLRKSGKQVVLLEAMDRVLARVAGQSTVSKQKPTSRIPI